MQTRINTLKWASCQYAEKPLDQLTDEQLLVRRTKNRQTLGVVAMFMALMVVMAFVLDGYLVAACTSVMIPALDDYEKKRKAIKRESRKRNLR